MPPALLISSNVNNRTSLSDVSLMAIVPLNEWSTPTLTVSAAEAVNATSATLAAVKSVRSERFMFLFQTNSCGVVARWGWQLKEIADARADQEAVLHAVESVF